MAARHGAVPASTAPGPLPTLSVPPQVAITPAFLASLPPLAATDAVEYTWHPARPAIVWRGPSAGDGPTSRRQAAAPEVLDLSSAAAIRAAEWRLLRGSGKPQDGWLSRHVHRHVSRLFSYVFLKLGLSANVATVLTFFVGVAAAVCMAQTTHATMLAGGFLFWFASIADGIDGEVARLTLSESRFGEQLDTGVDQLTHLSGLIGVLVGWWRQGLGPWGLALVAIVLVGTPAVLAWAMALVRQARETDQFFVPTKPIEIAIFRARDETGALGLRVAGAVFILFRREAFSFSFFVLSLVTDRRAAIPAAIALGLGVVVVTLLAYGPILRRMLRETVGPRAAGRATSPPARSSAAPA